MENTEKKLWKDMEIMKEMWNDMENLEDFCVIIIPVVVVEVVVVVVVVVENFVRNVIIEDSPRENKMARKGQITSERARKNDNRTRTS